MSEPTDDALRLAELMASFSLAIDLGTGQRLEWVIRCTLLGARLAEALHLGDESRRQVYYLSLLRHIGCTATAHSDAEIFDDELAVPEAFMLDSDNPAEMMRFVLSHAGQGRSPARRWQALARLLSAGPGPNQNAHCEVAARLADRLGFNAATQDALWQVYERWDGKGAPKKLKGEAIALPVRVIQLAQDAATFFQVGGVELARATIQGRAGRQLDPGMADLFAKQAAELCAGLEAASSWEALLAAEPGPAVHLAGEKIDAAVRAVADFTDLKSPFLLNHSRHVAGLMEAAARGWHLPARDERAGRRAALIHDIGRVGISASIWDKAGPLSESEWERVRLHPYYTERIFTRSGLLAPLGVLAAQHHERLDGSGYHHHLLGPSLARLARLLAACDAYCAMTERRPQRPALSPEQAAAELRREARAGKFDAQVVDVVLSAAGHAVDRARSPATTDLSPREIEVLRLLARGYTNRQMAAQLIIAEKTVGHHVQHIYNKIGVSTRAGATLFALQNDLL